MQVMKTVVVVATTTATVVATTTATAATTATTTPDPKAEKYQQRLTSGTSSTAGPTVSIPRTTVVNAPTNSRVTKMPQSIPTK